MGKSQSAFRTISEVSEWLDTPAHVLRFWESKFSQIKPVKRAGGRRYYRPEDMSLLGGIKTLLHEQGMTIKGVQKLLREQGVRHVCALGPDPLDPIEIDLEGEFTPAPDEDEDEATTAKVVSLQPRRKTRQAPPRLVDDRPSAPAPAARPPEPAAAPAPRPPVPGLLGLIAARRRGPLGKNARKIAPLVQQLRDISARMARD